MDAKALAKSKRAHSQHHSKKYHPNQKAKSPAGANQEAVSAKTPIGKQIKERTKPKPKPSQEGTSALPSNWDRYEEAVASAAGVLNQASDIVLPKSKGADYGHLIAEAQSHSQLDIHSDTFPSFDHVLPDDWSKGIESMLSVRGLQRAADLVDDLGQSGKRRGFIFIFSFRAAVTELCENWFPDIIQR